MRFPIRVILAGLLIGAAFYFVPFGFPFFFLFLLIFILVRLFFGWRYWHGGYGDWYGYPRRFGYGPGCGYPYNRDEEPDITPIDGNAAYRPGTSSVSKKINIQ